VFAVAQFVFPFEGPPMYMVLGVTAAFAGEIAKPSTRARDETPESMVLLILFTLIPTEIVRIDEPYFSTNNFLTSQNVRVAHHKIATQQPKGWFSEENQPLS
jgi:hypothetical protein